VIASEKLFDSRGGVLGSRYPMKTAEVDGLKDVATDFGTTAFGLR